MDLTITVDNDQWVLGVGGDDNGMVRGCQTTVSIGFKSCIIIIELPLLSYFLLFYFSLILSNILIWIYIYIYIC